MINNHCYAELPESDAFLFEIHSRTITSMEKATCSYTSEQIDPKFALISCFKTRSEQLSRNWVTHEDFVHSSNQVLDSCLPRASQLVFCWRSHPKHSCANNWLNSPKQNEEGACGNETCWTQLKKSMKKHCKVNTKVQQKTKDPRKSWNQWIINFLGLVLCAFKVFMPIWQPQSLLSRTSQMSYSGAFG